MKKTYNLENSIERGDFIRDSFRIFNNEQVLMTCSDCLTYVFDNTCEAISYIIHRVKEFDYIGYFKEAYLFNINTRDMGVYIKTDLEAYTIKTLESYRYVSEEKRVKEENKELKFFLGDSKEKFAESINSKVKLIKAELEAIDFSDTKVTKILNRYFGNGWKSYWYTTNQLTQSSVEVILNVVLSDNTNLRLPISIERVTALKLPASIIKRKENNDGDNKS